MKPIAIFRHAPSEGPGHFATFLDRHSRPWTLITSDTGSSMPKDAADYAGLVFMGGPMSVNDDLPWIEPTLNLIRQAVASGTPVLGHCLGGQLIAKALGGRVSSNPIKEIGWGAVQVTESEAGRRWFGDISEFQAFHWHGETFSLPPGGERILSSPHCLNQAFSYGEDGRHLAMQCHVEMTREMIESWCEIGVEEIEAALESPGVQPAAQILSRSDQLLPPLNRTAERLYARWLAGIEH
jgi:GMP synthase-like glutamine amidotransferase